MIRKKHGFSLIELIIAIAILAILAALFVPAILSSNSATREDADTSDINNLATTLQLAAQTNNIYKNGKYLAGQSDNNTIKMVFAPNDDFVLECVEVYIVNENGKYNEIGEDDINLRLMQLKGQFVDYINGIIEPVLLSSEYYRTQKFIFALNYPDVDLKVDVSWVVEEVGLDDIFNWPDENDWSNLYPDPEEDEDEETPGENPGTPTEPTNPNTKLEISEIFITKDNRNKFGFNGTDNEVCNLVGSYVQGNVKYVAIGIDTEAFKDCTKLKSITIPETIIVIKDKAFYGCTKLESVRIAESVLEIGQECFKQSGLKTITIPNTVTKLGDAMFESCTSLTTADITDSVFRLGKNMFRGCTALSSITMPNELREIGTQAFENCSSLGAISIPQSVNKIETMAFKSSGVTHCTLPSALTYMGDAVFQNSKIVQINIPDKITTIPTQTFYQCTSLKTVTTHNNIVAISNEAFRGCSQLNTCAIPSKLVNVGESAFYGCSALTGELNLPSTVVGIAAHAFRGTGYTKLTMQNNVSTIEQYAFYGCNKLTSATISNKVTVLSRSVFENCKKLASIALPNSIVTISQAAFKNCEALADMKMPTNINTIDTQAFYGCKSIIDVGFPKSLRNLGRDCFTYCDGLLDVAFSKNTAYLYNDSLGRQMGSNQVGYTRNIEFLFLERGFAHTPVPTEKWGAINALIVWVDDIDERWVGEIKYTLNGGSVTGNPVRYKVTDTIVLKNPTRLGYDFTGWTGSNGATKQLTVTINRGTQGDLHYTANWNPRSDTKYTLRYFNMDVYGNYSETPTFTEQKQGVTDSTLTLSAIAKTQEGMTFAYGQVGTTTCETTTILPDGSRVIDLYYSRNKYSVDVNAYVDGEYVYTGLPGTFDVWINGKLDASGVKDYWRDNSVYYGSEVHLTAVADTGYRCQDPEMEGFVPVGGLSLAPRFVTNKYTIKFHAAGAPNGSMEDVTVKYTDSFTLPQNKFSWAGYSFIGWGLTLDGGVNYVDGATVSQLSSSLDGIVNLYAKWDAKSSDLITADEFNAKLPSTVKEVRFVTTVAPAGAVLTDYSYAQDGGVVGWIDGTTLFISSQRSNTAINAKSCDGMFKNKTNIEKILFYNLNTTQVTSMKEMFYGCSKLKSVNAEVLSVNAVGDTTSMFRGCSALTTLNLSSWDTTYFKTIDYMFQDCTSITTLDLNNWKTSSVTSMKYTFRGMENLVTLNVNRWNTTKVVTAEGVFYQCKAITAISLSGWDTTSFTDMRTMFAHCNNLVAPDISKFKTNNNTRFDWMFENNYKVVSLDLSHFNTDKVTTMQSMFTGCSSLKTLNISSFNTAILRDSPLPGSPDIIASPMGSMFNGCTSLEKVIVGNKFTWVGTNGYLPAISSSDVQYANGKWYDIETAVGYTPAELANIQRTTVKTYSSIPYYWLDIVNGIKDGVYTDTLKGMATVDVYINGTVVATNQTDWYKCYPHGTTYELKNIKSTSNSMYQGFRPATTGDTIKGTLTHETIGWHVFDTSANVYHYTGSVQTFTAPATGYYLVEVWGAQGGSSLADGLLMGTGARGGYSKGNVYLNAGQTLYISVGGQGATPKTGTIPAGGWNGGGKGMHDHSDDEVGGAGGGATSITKTLVGDGQLKNYASYQHQVVIVAGGGAGSIWQSTTGGGVGGGLNGGLGTGSAGVSAATQTSGYAFGQGEDGYWDSSWGANQAADGMSGGGGGWYGGRSSRQHDNFASTSGDTGCAGGGSSYIGGVVNGSTTSGVNLGNGMAKITYSGIESSAMPSVQEFEFTGSAQTFIVPETGYYQLEVWGAEGGMGYNKYNNPGLGGYTSGITYLTKGTTLYVYVGEDGIDQFQRGGTFNGGGEGQDPNSYVHIGGRGGGASDIRLVGGAWNSVEGLQSRIIVAGGGGGAQSSCGNSASSGHGGGLVGGTSFNMSYQSRDNETARSRAYSLGGSQSLGGLGYNVNDGQTARIGQGGFGYGAASVVCGAGGGGGYYGGGTSYTSGGGGGSSYVTGYPGCDTTYRNKQGGYNFTGVVMSQGVNNGNGKAKIAYIGSDIAAQPYKLTINNTHGDIASFDIYINNSLVANDARQWVGYVPAGSTYEVKDVKSYEKRDVTKNPDYISPQETGFSGTVNSDTTKTISWVKVQVGGKSNAEQVGTNEWTRTTYDLASLIDQRGTGKYMIYFDAYSPVPGASWVYMQNGSDSKYKMQGEVQLTKSWKRYYCILDVTKGENVANSYLAFYGEYGTGRYVHVRNIAIAKVP